MPVMSHSSTPPYAWELDHSTNTNGPIVNNGSTSAEKSFKGM